MKLTPSQENFIGEKVRSFDVWADDPWRCDFCDDDCSCYDDGMKEYVDHIIAEFPELKEHRAEIADKFESW